MLEEILKDGSEDGNSSADKINLAIVEVNDIAKGTRPINIEIVNKTGAGLANGTPVRHNGVDVTTGLPQVVKAQANSYDNARLLGVIADDILNNETGFAVNYGPITGVDTSNLQIGVPIFLSSDVAGELTEAHPAIVTQVGGVEVSDAVNGVFFVDIISNLSLPQTIGYLFGQVNPIYNLVAIEQSIVNYESEGNIVTTTDKVNGTVTPKYDGISRATVNLVLSFASTTQTRTIYVSLHNKTDDIEIKTFPISIPRDATEDSASFSFPFEALAGKEYDVRVGSVPDMASTTVSVVAFDIASVHIH